MKYKFIFLFILLLSLIYINTAFADTITVNVSNAIPTTVIPTAPSTISTSIRNGAVLSGVAIYLYNGSTIQDLVWAIPGATITLAAANSPSSQFIQQYTSGYGVVAINLNCSTQDISSYFNLPTTSIIVTSSCGPTPTPTQTPTPSGPTPTPSPIPTPGPSNQFPISFQSQSGVLFSSNQEIGTGVIFPYTVQLNAGLPLAQGSLEIAPTLPVVFQLVRTFYISGSPTVVNIGTITFTSGSLYSPIISFGSPVIFNPGDKLQLYAPASIDATASGLTLTIVGNIL